MITYLFEDILPIFFSKIRHIFLGSLSLMCNIDLNELYVFEEKTLYP